MPADLFWGPNEAARFIRRQERREPDEWLDDIWAEVRRMLGPFLTGYQSVYALEPEWISGAELHMTLRELELYAALVDTDINENGWDGGFMRGRRQRIDEERPFLGVPLADVL